MQSPSHKAEWRDEGLGDGSDGGRDVQRGVQGLHTDGALTPRAAGAPQPAEQRGQPTGIFWRMTSLIFSF